MARGRKRYQPNETDRRIAEALAQYGVPRDQIAARVGISLPILLQHYGDAMHKAAAAANNNIAKTLYKKAMDGDTTALIFWAKTRMGWRETQKMDLTSSDGSMSPAKEDAFNLAMFTPEQLRALRGLADEKDGSN